MKFILIAVISYGFKLQQFSVPLNSDCAQSYIGLSSLHSMGFTEFKLIIKRYNKNTIEHNECVYVCVRINTSAQRHRAEYILCAGLLKINLFQRAQYAHAQNAIYHRVFGASLFMRQSYFVCNLKLHAIANFCCSHLFFFVLFTLVMEFTFEASCFRCQFNYDSVNQSFCTICLITMNTSCADFLFCFGMPCRVRDL